jgi:hypothetical protein
MAGLQESPHPSVEGENVLRRVGSKFMLHANTVSYVRHLRRERPQSPRAAADAELAKAKARWLELRVMEKEETLMETSECNDIIDGAIGIVLTSLHSIPPRLFPLDLEGRRRAERVILDVRKTIADRCQRHAQECEAELAASEPSGDA